MKMSESFVSFVARGWARRKRFVPLAIIILLAALGMVGWHMGDGVQCVSEWRYHNLVRRQQSLMDEVNVLWKQANLYPSTNEKRWKVLQQQMEEKVAPLKREYEAFLRKNPVHYRAMTSYGSLLEDTGHHGEALAWWSCALRLMPHYALLLNEMANSHARRGHVLPAIYFYEAASRLSPGEAVYHFNLGNMYYLFQNETARLHGWNSKDVFSNALMCFRMARECDDSKFEYAASYAETFYGMNVLFHNRPWKEALAAWEHCLAMKLEPEQQDFVRIHLVRVSALLKDPVASMRHWSKIRDGAHRKLASRLFQQAFPDSFAGLLQI